MADPNKIIDVLDGPVEDVGVAGKEGDLQGTRVFVHAARRIVLDEPPERVEYENPVRDRECLLPIVRDEQGG